MKQISLDTLCDGYVSEKIKEELGKICDNIMDERMDESTKRELNIKIVFAPKKDDPEIVVSAVTVSSKLAPELIGTQFTLEKDYDGDIKMLEYHKGQIKGQLTFKDLSDDMNPPELEVM